MNGTLTEVGERYGVSQWSLSSHGLNHLDGYNRSWAAMNRENKKKSIKQPEFFERLERDELIGSAKVMDSKIPHRSVGNLCKMSDFPEPKATTVTKETVVQRQIRDYHQTIDDAKNSVPENMPIDDLILEHKLEITKLEHMKSLGKQVV